MTAKAIPGVLAIAFGVISANGCVVSVEPFLAESGAIFDSRILGN